MVPRIVQSKKDLSPMPELSPATGTLPLLGNDSQDLPPGRRRSREKVEMMARFRRGLANTTVVLKDLTPLGARIEGVGPLEADEVITLTLPECRPMIAFVAWAGSHSAGLEFVHPLPDDLFAELVTLYGLRIEGPA